MADAENEEPAVTLIDLPFECLVECLSHLTTAEELVTTSYTCQTLNEAASVDVLWRGLCVRHQHGQVRRRRARGASACLHLLHDDRMKPLTPKIIII